jgi:chaperonin GroES
MGDVNIKPLSDRVLIRPLDKETNTGGIIIPDSVKEKSQQGLVMSVGPGKKDEPMTVKIGDLVLYGKYSGTEVEYDGEKYLIMRESDIYAIIIKN